MVVPEPGHGIGDQLRPGVGWEALDKGRQLRHAHPPGDEVGGAEVGEGDVHGGDSGLEPGISRAAASIPSAVANRGTASALTASYQAGGVQPRAAAASSTACLAGWASSWA